MPTFQSLSSLKRTGFERFVAIEMREREGEKENN